MMSRVIQPETVLFLLGHCDYRFYITNGYFTALQ